MNILLVEPDTKLAATYCAYLQMSGEHIVRRVATAQTAIHAIDTQQPDVIVLELQLAKHSGIEFLYELRSYPEWQHIPVLVHTVVPASSLALGQKSLASLGVVSYAYKSDTTLAKLLTALESITVPTRV